MFVGPADLPLPGEYRMLSLQGLIQQAPADIAERTVVFLDCGNIDRNSASVLRDGRHLLNIDHHHDNTRFGTLNHVVPEASCTAEIVWDLMGGLGERAHAGDRGGALRRPDHRHRALHVREHRCARAHDGSRPDRGRRGRARGLQAPVRGQCRSASSRCFRSRSAQVQRYRRRRARAGEPLGRGLRAGGAEESYSEGIIDQLRTLAGTKVAVLVRELSSGEKAGQHKVSLRATDDDVDVSIDRARPGRRRPPPRRGLLHDARRRGADRLPARGDRGAAARLLGRPAAARSPERRAADGAAETIDGVLLIDKPAGITSHDVVAAVRRALGGACEYRPRRHARPVRHRPAAGARRPCHQIPAAADGAAQALRDRRPLGALSSTGDTEGEITETGRIPADPPALPVGEVRQRPPMLLGGEGRRGARLPARSSRRALRDARADRDGAPLRASCWRPPRTTPQPPRAAFAIECGSGTYVRSLIADLGDAYCLELRRTAIGPFERGRRGPAAAARGELGATRR